LGEITEANQVAQGLYEESHEGAEFPLTENKHYFEEDFFVKITSKGLLIESPIRTISDRKIIMN